MGNLGLALSGGGSRAMAFHRGALGALEDLGLVESIAVVSTVSGGSVFGAAWICSRLRGDGTGKFLADLIPVLRRGFVAPALLSPRALKMLLWPGFTRTHRLAEVFSETLLDHRKLGELPERPALCINAAALNHAMPARFSRGGFSCSDVGERDAEGHLPDIPLLRRDLGFAVAASAAFPFALPPLAIEASEILPLRFQGKLDGHRWVHLTDGGVLENLGTERLLSRGRFGTRHVIVSDAGTADSAWAPSLWQKIRSAGAYALSRETLSRLLTMMNDKQNKTMRQLLVHQVGAVDPPRGDRRLWFVRVDTSWEAFFRGIPQARRRALAGGGDVPSESASAAEVVAFLERHGVRLERAKSAYRPGDDARANAVGTSFTGLAAEDIEALERHARWQVHACHAVYGDLVDRDASAVAARAS